MMDVNLMLLGASAMACFTISLFFLRFFRTTRDRFFVFFSLSFFLEGACRVVLGFYHYSHEEQEPLIYILRLISLATILLGIIDKNRSRSAS